MLILEAGGRLFHLQSKPCGQIGAIPVKKRGQAVDVVLVVAWCDLADTWTGATFDVKQKTGLGNDPQKAWDQRKTSYLTI